MQDPLPELDHVLIGGAEIAALTQAITAKGLSVSDLAFTAFSAAASFRDSDKRSGAAVEAVVPFTPGRVDTI